MAVSTIRNIDRILAFPQGATNTGTVDLELKPKLGLVGRANTTTISLKTLTALGIGQQNRRVLMELIDKYLDNHPGCDLPLLIRNLQEPERKTTGVQEAALRKQQQEETTVPQQRDGNKLGHLLSDPEESTPIHGHLLKEPSSGWDMPSQNTAVTNTADTTLLLPHLETPGWGAGKIDFAAVTSEYEAAVEHPQKKAVEDNFDGVEHIYHRAQANEGRDQVGSDKGLAQVTTSPQGDQQLKEQRHTGSLNFAPSASPEALADSKASTLCTLNVDPLPFALAYDTAVPVESSLLHSTKLFKSQTVPMPPAESLESSAREPEAQPGHTQQQQARGRLLPTESLRQSWQLREQQVGSDGLSGGVNDGPKRPRRHIIDDTSPSFSIAQGYLNLLPVRPKPF